MRHRINNLSMAVVLLATTLSAAATGSAQELVRIYPPHDEVMWREAPRPYYGHTQESFVRLTEFEQDSQLLPAPEVAVPNGKGAGCCCCLAFVGGIESTFLFPVLDDAPASVRIEEVGNADPLYTSGEVELDDNLFLSPRVWGGLEYCNWGLIGRVWWLGDSDSAFSPETPFFRQTHVATARLQAYTADVELYKRWCTCLGGERRFAVGFRYANWEAMELVEAHGEVGGDFVQGIAQTHRRFDGPGFTIGFSGTHCCDCSCLKLFYGVRGSVMWGDIRKEAQTTAWAFDPNLLPGTANNFSTAVAVSDDIAFIGEAQIGVQWEHQLACSCARVFVRTAIEYQHWSADEGDAAAGSLAFTNGAIVTSLATADDFQMNLVGFTLATGLTW